jgi:hypothetical protein
MEIGIDSLGRLSFRLPSLKEPFLYFAFGLFSSHKLGGPATLFRGGRCIVYCWHGEVSRRRDGLHQIGTQNLLEEIALAEWLDGAGS